MIVADVLHDEPIAGDNFFIECGDTLIETTICDIVEDGIVIQLDESATTTLEGFLSTFKNKATERMQTHAGNVAMESLGYIFGIVASSTQGWSLITNALRDEDKLKLQRAIDQLKTDPNWIDNSALKAGMRDGISDSRSNNSNLDELIRLKFSKIANSMKFLNIRESTEISEAEYQGRKVTLGKPFLTPDGPKKRSVYVKNPKGNVVKVNFGDKKMKIKKSNPTRRKSFRARHNCANPGPRHKARYWSCKAW